jgi:hypothetical protein
MSKTESKTDDLPVVAAKDVADFDLSKVNITKAGFANPVIALPELNGKQTALLALVARRFNVVTVGQLLALFGERTNRTDDTPVPLYTVLDYFVTAMNRERDKSYVEAIERNEQIRADENDRARLEELLEVAEKSNSEDLKAWADNVKAQIRQRQVKTETVAISRSFCTLVIPNGLAIAREDGVKLPESLARTSEPVEEAPPVKEVTEEKF